jgi:hypothetical protein
MAGRLERLLRDFRWDRMDRVFGQLALPAEKDLSAAVSLG